MNVDRTCIHYPRAKCKVKNWYLIHTKPRKEPLAEQHLQRQGYEIYLPRIQETRKRRGHWIKNVEPLFPRYLFVQLESGVDDFSPIRSTVGVSNLVKFSQTPCIVPDSVIAALKSSANRETNLHGLDRPVFEAGNIVQIDRGPLAGLQAIFVAETSQERVVLLLDMLGRENKVVIERDFLRRA